MPLGSLLIIAPDDGTIPLVCLGNRGGFLHQWAFSDCFRGHCEQRSGVERLGGEDAMWIVFGFSRGNTWKMFPKDMLIWGFPEMGDAQKRWFLMENPSINGWFRVPPIAGNHHVLHVVWYETARIISQQNHVGCGGVVVWLWSMGHATNPKNTLVLYWWSQETTGMRPNKNFNKKKWNIKKKNKTQYIL